MAEELPNECCAKCRFGYMPNNFEGDVTVQCRRRSPVYYPDRMDKFPTMCATEWCGEFGARFSTPIDAAGFSPRTKRKLKDAGISLVEQLFETEADTLLHVHSFGEMSLQEIRETLAERGSSLKGEGVFDATGKAKS